jgi:hypothetical protein
MRQKRLSAATETGAERFIVNTEILSNDKVFDSRCHALCDAGNAEQDCRAKAHRR